MSDNNEVDLNDYTFDIDFPTSVPSLPELNIPSSNGIDRDVIEDYERARETYYELIQKGNSALNQLLIVASSSESPRAFEVVSQLIKTIAEANDRVMALQEQIRKVASIDNAEKEEGSTTNNIIFTGSMTDFQMMLKEMKKKSITQEEDEENTENTEEDKEQ